MLNKKCATCFLELSVINFSKSNDPNKSKTGYQSSCKLCMKIYQQNRYKNRKKEINSKNNEWYNNNKESVIARTSKYKIEKMKVDPLFKLMCMVRNRVGNSLKTKNFKKNKRTFDLVGCSIENLYKHLESSFKLGMNWDNHGDWHIDHIVPLSSAKTTEEIYSLCHYSNLQALWAHENYIKSNKKVAQL
jgi:Zn-finger protein